MNAHFDGTGLRSIRFLGTEYLNTGAFHAEKIVLQTSGGEPVSEASVPHGQRGKTEYNAERQTAHQSFAWGAITATYAVRGNALHVSLKTENRSPFTIQSVTYEVLSLRFPAQPSNFDGVTPILGFNMGNPTVLPLKAGPAAVVLSNDDVIRPLILGFPWALDKPKNTVFPVRLTTGKEPMYPESVPAIQRPIPPGADDVYDISLSFGASTEPPYQIAGHVVDAFTRAYPPVLQWKDRRPIGQLILCRTAPAWPKNPRGWFLDASLDVSTPAGVENFHNRLIEWADHSISYLKNLDAQGMITWDIEGQQYEQPTTYVGDPRLIGQLAPEMAGIATEFFKRFRAAGFRVGVCIRPQRFVMAGPGGRASQAIPDDVAQNLIDKIRYAREQWGATLFYIDSNGDPGAPTDISIMRKVARAVPDVLLIPEHKNLAYYSITAPYTELRSGNSSTPPEVLGIYPKAFSVVNVTDGPMEKEYGQLQSAVERGDTLLSRAWFADPAIDRVRALYSYVGRAKE